MTYILSLRLNQPAFSKKKINVYLFSLAIVSVSEKTGWDGSIPVPNILDPYYLPPELLTPKKRTPTDWLKHQGMAQVASQGKGLRILLSFGEEVELSRGRGKANMVGVRCGGGARSKRPERDGDCSPGKQEPQCLGLGGSPYLCHKLSELPLFVVSTFIPPRL